MTPHRSPRALAGAVALLALASACVSYGVRTDYDPSTSFDDLRSYRWLEIQPTGDPRVDNELLMRRVMRAVDAELSAKGLSQSATDPDLLVVYHAAVTRNVDVDTRVRSYGYGRRAYAETYVREYDMGSLIIDLVRADTKQLVWRGSAQARLHERVTPEQRDQRVRVVVAAILEDFPPER